MRKSVCVDCIWRNSCQRLARIQGIGDHRNSRHNVDVFEIIILTCSLKNYDRSYRTEDKDGKKLYYCTECGQMHQELSRIGINHKAKMEVNRKERMKELEGEKLIKAKSFKN